MTRPIALAIAVLFALCATSPLLAANSSAPGSSTSSSNVTLLSDGSAVYTWDANAVYTDSLEMPDEGQLVTSNPSAFTGPSVASIIGANTFYTNGYTGSGTISLNVEAGHIWNGHSSLTHVTSFSNHATAPGGSFATTAFDRHATWVGMMIGGRTGGMFPGDYQTGIAPDTDLRSGAIATSWGATAYATGFSRTTATTAYPYDPANGGFGTADVINSSWGSIGAGAGSPERQGTDERSMIIDSLANQNRFTTFVASAGNNGATTNTVGAPGAGYNGITVGALANDGSNVYDTVASFSSRAPQDYGDPINGLVAAATAWRAAVDIVAPGDTLTSAFYGGQTGGNDASLTGSAASGGANSYTSNLPGTSFAAPIVTGSVALMHEAAADQSLPVDARDSRVIKANLLNAADKIPGWDNGQTAHPNANGGVITTQALDFAAGAGALDMDRTYTQYLLGQTDLSGTSGGTTPETIGWDYGIVSHTGYNDVVISTPMAGGSEFRATLSWFRERTYTDATSQTDVGYADLDLQIWDSTFTTLYSESISAYTPVEHLTFDLPGDGLYGIRVAYIGNVFGSLSSEEYGLAWWGVPVPEPSTYALALIGLASLVFVARRRN